MTQLPATIHQPLPPFAAWAGPRQAKTVIVGEAWGESEATVRQPFVGSSGKELWLMLGEAWPQVAPELHANATEMHRYDLAWVRHRQEWLEAAGLAMTNVLAFRPPDNKIEHLCYDKSSAGPGYPLPALDRGKYLRREYLSELTRLFEELATAAPNLVIALGNTACWALLRAVNIGGVRGAVAESPGLVLGASAPEGSPDRVLGRGLKILPTYHPAAVLRQWSWRPIVVADLMKAGREREFPEIRRPRRQVLVNPSLDEVRQWVSETLASLPPRLACDIETGAGQIKCVGFARSTSEALVIPFVDQGKADYSYWPTVADEREAWTAVRQLLNSGIPLVGQNFIYDLQYLMQAGLRPRSCQEDTMLLHHSLFPEMQKGLGFLGSIYTDEASWKLMRRQRPDTEKRDE